MKKIILLISMLLSLMGYCYECGCNCKYEHVCPNHLTDVNFSKFDDHVTNNKKDILPDEFIICTQIAIVVLVIIKWVKTKEQIREIEEIKNKER